MPCRHPEAPLCVCVFTVDTTLYLILPRTVRDVMKPGDVDLQSDSPAIPRCDWSIRGNLTPD